DARGGRRRRERRGGFSEGGGLHARGGVGAEIAGGVRGGARGVDGARGGLNDTEPVFPEEETAEAQRAQRFCAPWETQLAHRVTRLARWERRLARRATRLASWETRV